MTFKSFPNRDIIIAAQSIFHQILRQESWREDIYSSVEHIRLPIELQPWLWPNVDLLQRCNTQVQESDSHLIFSSHVQDSRLKHLSEGLKLKLFLDISKGQLYVTRLNLALPTSRAFK